MEQWGASWDSQGQESVAAALGDLREEGMEDPKRRGASGCIGEEALFGGDPERAVCHPVAHGRRGLCHASFLRPPSLLALSRPSF